MIWKVNFYKNTREEINAWPKSIGAKFTWIADLMEQFGPSKVGMPHVKAMGHGLFEIRAKAKDGIGRALFCMVVGKNVIILHSFIKKTEKTPKSELELAKKRMLEVKEIWKNL